MIEPHYTVPAGWQKGALLDLKRFNNGSFTATLLGEDANAEGTNVMHFDSSFDAQNFVSYWYEKPAIARA